MHKKPLTRLEEAGLRLHGLETQGPSQLSDAFRQGVAWAQSQAVPPSLDVSSSVEVLSEHLLKLHSELSGLLDCPANIVEASVSKEGVDASPPYQVVLDVSMSLTRRRKALTVLKESQPLAQAILQASFDSTLAMLLAPGFINAMREATTTTGLTSLAVDLHREKAAEMFCIPECDVTDEQRRQGKAANFYSIYHSDFTINSPAKKAKKD